MAKFDPRTYKWKYLKQEFEGSYSIAEITKWLRSQKFTVVGSGRKLAVNHRAKVIPVELADELQYRLEGRRITNLSINVNGISISVSMALKGNAGEDNEEYLMKRINETITSIGSPVNVVFKTTTKKAVVKDVVEVYLSGRNTSGHKKADIELWTKAGKMIPISIKQNNASFFSSADSELKDLAEAAVKLALDNSMTEFQMDPLTKIRRISPDLLIEPTDREKEFAIFGNDILKGKGAIIRQSFTINHFKFVEPNVLEITVQEIWSKLSEVPENEQPVIQIRNDKDRNRSHPLLKGLRALTIKQSVAPKNGIWIDRKKLAA